MIEYNQEYTFDLRKWQLKDEKKWDELRNSVIYSVFKDVMEDIFHKSQGIQYESEHHPNIWYDDLKVGDVLAYNIIDMMESSWVDVVITHLYGGVIFFKIITKGHPDYGKEEYVGKKSFAGQFQLYPKKVIVKGDLKLSIKCPLTEVVYDNDITTIGSYSTTFDLSNTYEKWNSHYSK